MQFKIIMGLDCNLKCSYCYQLQDCAKKEISTEVLDKFIERFNKLEGVHHINIFGGEPLLYFEKIKYLLSKIDKRHIIDITTNGTFRDRFGELEEFWGKPIGNLLSNKEHKNYNKLNELSHFRWVATQENIEELTPELIQFLALEYRNKIHFKYDFSKKWEFNHIRKLQSIQTEFQKYLGLNFRIDLPIGFRNENPCIFNEPTCFINWNGDYLACHRVQNSKIGNILESDFIFSNNKKCFFEVKNHYSYGNYEFKGVALFCHCD